jgi:hypothetical protein
MLFSPSLFGGIGRIDGIMCRPPAAIVVLRPPHLCPFLHLAVSAFICALPLAAAYSFPQALALAPSPNSFFPHSFSPFPLLGISAPLKHSASHSFNFSLSLIQPSPHQPWGLRLLLSNSLRVPLSAIEYTLHCAIVETSLELLEHFRRHRKAPTATRPSKKMPLLKCRFSCPPPPPLIVLTRLPNPAGAAQCPIDLDAFGRPRAKLAHSLAHSHWQSE